MAYAVPYEDLPHEHYLREFVVLFAVPLHYSLQEPMTNIAVGSCTL